MKKLNYKKAGIIILWVLVLSGLVTSLAFVNKKEKQIRIENLNINILNPVQNQFIDEDDIRTFFKEHHEELLNAELKTIDINNLERILNAHPAVENAEFSVDINGDVKIEVLQRTPVVRIINLDGESYYIDSQSKLMPLSEKYTSRVLIANGRIAEPYARRYNFSVKQIEQNEIFNEVSVLDDIYRMAEYIVKDTILNNLIHQININEENEIELIPSIGNHIIKFGEAKDISEKFEKLKVFYTEGLNKTNNWNKYSTINLKYKNQVVCTKK